MPQLSETLQAGCDVFNNNITSVALTGCHSDIRGKHVRPFRELIALLPRKIKQRSQHFCSQVSAHQLDPIEWLIFGQRVQHFDSPLTDQSLEFLKIARRHYMMHRAALVIMLWRIHRDEHLQNHVGLWIDNGDGGFRGKSLGIALDCDDILVASDRPERTGGTVRLIVDGALLTESSK